MAVFLNEDEMGRDDDMIGFPHLLVCMGFVARTNNELWGVHLSDLEATKVVFPQFCMWAQGRGLAKAAITDIYGCCHRRERYKGPNDHGAWVEEMQWFARELGGWHGTAHGFDTGVLNPQNGTYVEYDLRRQGGVRIFHKLHEETEQAMAPRTLADSPANDIRRYNPQSFSPGFRSVSPTLSCAPTGSGVLNELNYNDRLRHIDV